MSSPQMSSPQPSSFLPPSLPIPIAFCITDLDAGGAERALVQIITRLDPQQWQPSVICLSAEGELVAPLQNANIPVHCLNAKSSRDLFVLRRLTKTLKQIQPTLLQTFLFHANIMGRIAGRWAKVPHIISGIRVAEKRSAFYLALDRWTSKAVDHHVCVSERVKQFSIEQGGLSEDTISVIPNGVDWKRFANATPTDLSQWDIPDNSEVILTVGRLDAQKNVLWLLETIEPLLKENRNRHLLYVGQGSQDRQLEAAITERGLQKQVHLAGYHSDVSGFLKSATLFVLASKWEGMPNVVLEAMAAGLAVVSTDVEGIDELIPTKQHGIIVPQGDSACFQASTKMLLESPILRTEIATNTQTLHIKELTWESVTKKYALLYQNQMAASR